MNHFPEAWGRVSPSNPLKSVQELTTLSQPRDDVYGPYSHSHLQSGVPNTHTQSPIVTGTSVIAIKFKDGVVIAADNLGKTLFAAIKVQY